MNSTVANFPFNKGVDPRSGIEEYELSFFLKYYLPTERISELQERTYFESLTNVLEEYEKELRLKQPDKHLTDVVASGSAVEGLLLPVFFNRSTGEKIFHSDFDILRVLPGIIASDVKYDGPDICYPMEAAAHPGFVKLQHRLGNLKLGYANNQDVTKFTEDIAVMAPPPNVTIFSHGPAATSESPMLPVAIDNVYAIKCSTWPKSAFEWKTRKRLWNWPTASMIKRIVSDGCLLVPVGHRLSSEPNLEWRISFSKAEKALAQSLTVFQKKAYVLVKMLHREYFSSPKIIATYHLKTILFWMCERLPESFWSDSNMSRCLFALLDEIIACLASHNLPNFFIPANNMISHIHRDFVETTLKKVLTLRRNPMEVILNFDQKYRLVRGPRKPWKYSIDFLSKTVKRAKNDSEVMACFEHGLIDIANLMVAQSGDVEWGSKEAFYFLKEAWGYQKLVCQRNNVESGRLIQYVSYHLHQMFDHMSNMPTKVTIQRLNCMVKCSIANCEVTADESLYASLLHSFAGTLSHAIALWEPQFDFHSVSRPLSDKEREEAKEQSELHHKMAIAVSADVSGLRTEYAKLLFHTRDFKEVINILGPQVNAQLDLTIEEKTRITRAELPTLEVKLQTIAKKYLNLQGGSISLPDIVIAVYYFIMAQMEVGCDKDALCDLMKQLKLACEHKRNENAMVSHQIYKALTELQAEKHH